MTRVVNIAQSGGNNVTMRNKIINGGMTIDQRNAGASVTPTTNGTYTLDRWGFYLSQASKFSVQQNAGSVTPPAGFTNYLGITSLSAYSVLSSDYFFARQAIEGFNFADLGWGTANARTVTLSFWVRSSLTGTFGGAMANQAENRSYPFTYTISSANTWEQKTITVAGDTTGTWIGSTNGAGLYLNFGIGVGSTLSGTAGAWAGSQFLSATGATSVVGTNGATFYITGVQLEAGTTATPFEQRLYGTELALCQRYAFMVNSANANGNYMRYCYGECTQATAFTGNIYFPVSMRAIPSLTVRATASEYCVYSKISITGCSAIPALGSDGSNINSVAVNGFVATGLTQGCAGALMSNANQTSFLLFTSEL